MNTTTIDRRIGSLATVRPPYAIERLMAWRVKYEPLPLEMKLAVRK